MKRLRKAFDSLIADGFCPASNCHIEGWGAVAIAATVVAGAVEVNASSSAASAQENAAANASGTQASMW